MIIITKTSKAAARPVSVEQISAAVMTNAQNYHRFIPMWRYHKQCCTSSTSNNCHYTNRNSLSKCLVLSGRFEYSALRQFVVIGLIGLILFVNCPIFVVAAARNSIRSIANNDGNDPYVVHSNWFEFQRQSLNQRSHSPPSQSQEIGNIFSQLGLFIQSRQRNASELAGNIFFKYYNT